MGWEIFAVVLDYLSLMSKVVTSQLDVVYVVCVKALVGPLSNHYICHYSHAPCIFEDLHVLRAVDENEGLRHDLTVINAPNYNAPLLVDVSVVQSFPGSKNPSAPIPYKPPDFYPTLSPSHRTSHSLTTTNSTNINDGVISTFHHGI